ncbi:MAG: zinc ABC transporter substrate-binding protein [Alphaproteobacteria bacterium]|nr:zinc ABC transporter substrate-binding protein [Alphaproteobacteria bacterium]
MTFRRLPLFLVTTFLLFNSQVSADSGLRVVTSIKPVHSLASAIMAGVGEPFLVIRGASPHAFTIRPSAAAALQEADVIFLISDGLETPLVGAIESLAGTARVGRQAEAPGLVLKTLRSGGAFEEDSHHDHAGHEDDHADEEMHAGHDEDAHEDDHAGHEDGAIDLHVWLDPANARAMAREMAAVLSEADPANAAA